VTASGKLFAMSALFVAMLSMMTTNASPTVINLQCEYMARPLAIETAAPRLSWNTQFAGQNWKQSAYQILVSSTTAGLNVNKADLWDSGKITGDESIQVEYQGKHLGSRQECFWKVRVWDASGTSSGWSKPQEWQMGLMTEADWGRSQWIGVTADAKANPAPYMRKDFTSKGKVIRARLYASGLGYADLHLNGTKVGSATERDPGYTNFDKRVLYVVHDVTAAIKSGSNTVGAVLGTGWYDVHDRATWRFEKAPWRGRPRMRLVLDIDYDDNRRETIVSDSSWKTASGPILFDGIYTGEVYDARLEIPGWDKTGFNDGGWKEVSVMPAPKGVLAGRICPPVAITQTIKPISIKEVKSGIFVVDFGQNFAGHTRIKLKNAPAGSKVTMRYSEKVDDKGMIERSEIGKFMTKEKPVQPFQTDVYIAKGGPSEAWEQRFSYAGYRYMEVTGFPGTPTADNFEGRFAHTDLESGGEFACSNEIFNKIQHATRYAYLSNAQSIPTDCPQREKNGWTGDAHLAAEAGLMNFKSASFYTKWLDDFADDQQNDGRFSLIIPSGGWGQGACHPSWDSAFCIIANDMANYQGDARLLTKHYEHLKRYVDYLSGQSKDDVVQFDSLGDWLPWKTETSSQLTSTVMLYLDAQIVARGAGLKGLKDDATKYSEMAERVKAGFNKHFFDPAKFSEMTQTALSLGIYFDLVPPEQKQAALDALIANVKTQGHIDTGIIGAKFILRVLSENGHTDLAYMLVARKEQPGWGWWITQGATTLWEDWKGESSLNHIMFGDVSNWFFQWIAGIGLDPSTAAFKHILIRPQPVGDLTWAKASVNSPYGKISSSWKRDAKGFHLTIEIPANASATVVLPGSSEKHDVGSGTYSFDAKI
jgi:alpha-L-rhamnosidase